MSPFTSVAIFLTIWWTVLFAVLPLGSQTYHELGLKPPGGGDPGAPVNPNLKRKFFTTTWISVIVFAVLWTVLHFGLIPLPGLPSETSHILR
jgi:predicted secreted protein